MKELEFINIISKNLRSPEFLGDDCAYLKDLNIVISQDSLVEDVHFTLDTISPSELGFKTVAVNVSDVCASGAKPLYLTVALSGKLTDKFVKKFYEGINEAEKTFDVEVVGGDLTGGEKISISAAILGSCEKRNISSRKNAKNGYIIGICGFSGSSAQGLISLQKGSTFCKNAHLKPKIQYCAACEAGTNTKFPYAMMDTSDGLYDALEKIAVASNVEMHVEYNEIPREIDDKNLVLFGGEDYSLVVAADERDFKSLKSFTKIGFVCKSDDNPKIIIDGETIDGKGLYDHFGDNNRGGQLRTFRQE